MVEGGYKHKDGLPLDKNNDKHVRPFLAKAKRWEAMPKRREMLTDTMLDIAWARQQAAKPDSLDDCFFDWLALGRYTGFRASEWAQSRTKLHVTTELRRNYGVTRKLRRNSP